VALTETSAVAWAANSTNTLTTGSFTPSANQLVVVCAAVGNGNGITSTSFAVSDNVSGSWSLLKTSGVGNVATASVWVKDAGSSPSAQTITVTALASTVLDVGFAVRQFAGALAAASQTGVTASNSSTSVAGLAITPGTTGSQVVGAYGNQTSKTLVGNAATTLYGTQAGGGGGDVVAAMEANTLSTAATPITVGFTVAASVCSFALAEILPAGTFAPTMLPQRRRLLQRRHYRPAQVMQRPNPTPGFEGWGRPL
jgi:hypothetical protein